MYKKLGYFVIFTLFIYCKTDDAIPDCSAYLCVTPNVLINLVDDTSEENIIIKNGITKESITIKDTLGSPIQFSIIESNGLLFVNKQTTKGVLKIKINSELIANISYNTSKPKTNECCDFGDLKEVTVENKIFNVKDNIITIYL